MNYHNKIRVLIVDDVSETRENVKKLLQFEVDVEVIGVARTGKEAVQASQDLNPDVILMDINMPDMDGIAATETIRAKQQAIQVVILSVQSDQNYMRRAMLAGARDFLTKPPMGDELISAIRRAGEMAQAEKEKNDYSLEERQALLFKGKGLELTRFDLESRLDLYKQSFITGKLVDSIEALVSGFAHDIRSPLDIILSTLGTIKITNEVMANKLRKIRQRCISCKWVADNFLGITLSEKPSSTNLPLRPIIEEAILLLEDRIPNAIKIENVVDNKTQAHVDVRLFRGALLNLLTNAIESMSNTGTITISAVQEKNDLGIFVEDDGNQIPTNNVENLFKVGFTTKPSHSGIGLYVSKRLLNQQNGDLNFARNFGKEVKLFCILLPKNVTDNTSSLTNGQLETRVGQLEKYVEELQNELSSLRLQKATDVQQEEIESQLTRITSSFCQNLTDEIIGIETSAIETMRILSSSNNEIRNSLEKIIKNCSYCRLLIRNLLELDMGITLEITNFSLINLIEDVLSLIDRKMPPSLYKIDWDVDFLMSDIAADATQLKQVFMNLIKNALDSMPNGGTLRIHLQQIDNIAQIEIGDTGCGIAPENLPRLFTLGFTTKPKGYGIGLYSIKNILERHNGTIKVYSKVNKGTTFQLQIPIIQSSFGG